MVGRARISPKFYKCGYLRKQMERNNVSSQHILSFSSSVVNVKRYRPAFAEAGLRHRRASARRRPTRRQV
jgi:hypothetical protein